MMQRPSSAYLPRRSLREKLATIFRVGIATERVAEGVIDHLVFEATAIGSASTIVDSSLPDDVNRIFPTGMFVRASFKLIAEVLAP